MAIVDKSKENKEYGNDVLVTNIQSITDSISKLTTKEFIKSLGDSSRKVIIEIEQEEVIRPSMTVKRLIEDMSRSIKLFVTSKDPDPQGQLSVVDWFFNNIGKNFTFVEVIDDNSMQVENFNESIKSLGKSCNRKGIKLVIISKVKNVSSKNDYNSLHSSLLTSAIRFEKVSKI